jgi:rhodanese-related sulfurtransferase
MRLRVVTVVLLITSFATPGCSQDLAWSSLKTTIRSQYPSVEHISTDSLAQWLDDSAAPDPYLIDARQPEEFAVSHLREGVNIPVDDSTWAALDTVATDTPIVVYCSVGYRSSEMAARLQEAGFTNVTNLEGSIFEWANEGRPVYRDGERVDEVHPYDAVWGKLLDEDLRAATP